MSTSTLLHARPVPGPHLPGTPCATRPQAGNPTAPWDCQTCRAVAAESGITDPWTTKIPIALSQGRTYVGPDSGPDRVVWHPPSGDGPHAAFAADLILRGRRWRVGTESAALCTDQVPDTQRECPRCVSLTTMFRADLVAVLGPNTKPFSPARPDDPLLTATAGDDHPVILRARSGSWHWRDITALEPHPVTGRVTRRNVVGCRRTGVGGCHECAILIAATIRRIRTVWKTSAAAGGDGQPRTAVDLNGTLLPAALIDGDETFATPGLLVHPAGHDSPDVAYTLRTRGPSATTHLQLLRVCRTDPEGGRWAYTPDTDGFLCGRSRTGTKPGKGRRPCQPCLTAILDAIPRLRSAALDGVNIDLNWVNSDPLGPHLIAAVMSNV